VNRRMGFLLSRGYNLCMATQTRERSTIAFPYNALEDAASVARTVVTKFGNSCDLAQLAAALGHVAVRSGAFQLRIQAARVFGLIDLERQQVNLSPLGRKLVFPATEASAKVEAFLSVPLYKAVYEEFKSGLLPPAQALDNTMMK